MVTQAMTTQHSKVSAAQLDAAYRATTYLADIPTGALPLRIDEPSDVLSRFLKSSVCRTWAFISAANPRSRQLEDTENINRHQALIAAVDLLDLKYYEGMGIPQTPDWPAERNLLILGITQAGAHTLAARFDQNAILFGTLDGIPRLQYVHSVREAI